MLPPNGMDDFLELRYDSETMNLFCGNILPHIMGKNLWKEGVYNMKVCDLASVTDEAFVLLALENIWDEWVGVLLEEFFGSKKRKMSDDGKRLVCAGKYTGGWRSVTRFGGWSTDGLDRMNVLIKLVKVNWEANKDCRSGERKEYPCQA